LLNYFALGNATADPIMMRSLLQTLKRNPEEEEWGLFEGSKCFVDGFSPYLGHLLRRYLVFVF